MPKAPLQVFYLAVMLLTLAGLHYYMWRRLVRATQLPARWYRLSTVALGALAGAIPITLLSRRLAAGSINTGWIWPAYVWMGIGLFLILLLALADSVRLLIPRIVAVVRRMRGQQPFVVDHGRRIFVSRAIAGGALTLAGGATVLGMQSALHGPQLVDVEVPLARLPQALDGFTIAQITDLHIGQIIGPVYVADVVRQVNQLAPDMIAITGDLVDGPPKVLGDTVAILADLEAPSGVWFVTGNHEYYSGIEPWLPFLDRHGINVMRNERVAIGFGTTTFDLAGIDDPTGARFHSTHGSDLSRAIKGRDPARELVLLAHQPKHIDAAAAAGVGLQISGHTHGGQIWPFTWLAHAVFPYVAGLANHKGTQIYVSRGSGFVGPPVRLGAASEITRIVLRSAVA